MALKKVKSQNYSTSEKPKHITVKIKKEVMAQHEKGVRVYNLPKKYDIAKSFIYN